MIKHSLTRYCAYLQRPLLTMHMLPMACTLLLLMASVLFLLMASVLVQAGAAHADDYFVTNHIEFNSGVSSAGPGDTVTMANGNWTNLQLEFNGYGNSANPITLRAETPGQVVINGNSTLDISGEWLVADGLKFEGGALSNGSRGIVEFKGDNGHAKNSRFTNSAIISYNPGSVDDRYHWVKLYGQDNRVENNRFENQNHSGVTIVVERDNSSSQSHVIAGNHFVNRPVPVNPSNPNGFETIRIGDSSESLSNSLTTIENNLFERIDGEIEIISNKSGGNTYRYNTFRESKGTLTLRHGNDNLVEGNFFLGEDKDGSGGIRIIGERQTIVNNYIANVDDRAGGAISISAGDPDGAINRYYPPDFAVIANNTVVNTIGPMMVFDHDFGDSDQGFRAKEVTVANNVFRSAGPAIFSGTEGDDWDWEGNIAHGGSLGSKAGDSGINNTDPLLQFDADGLWRLSSTSPAINASVGDYSSLITDDMDGQPRIGIYDVGADEFSAATIVRKPLEDGDVGPSWLQMPPDPPTGGGCFASGCSIQAEDYTTILDPDNDGLIWTRNSVVDALGGEVITAPNGNIVTSSNHDTLAVYDLTFQQSGSYKAYYRARGFSMNTDSIYVPNDFDTDPTVTQTLSNDSFFDWEPGQTFTITDGEVGVPLEFRIGRREQMAEFDALVLDLDHSLTAEELDALFDITFDAGDFDENGYVEADDLLAWQTGFGISSSATHMDGDADEDGDVDGLDFLIWQMDFTGPGLLLASTNQIPEPSSSLLILLGIIAAQSQLKYRNQLN